jgi:hypothetical protein
MASFPGSPGKTALDNLLAFWHERNRIIGDSVHREQKRRMLKKSVGKAGEKVQ